MWTSAGSGKCLPAAAVYIRESVYESPTNMCVIDMTFAAMAAALTVEALSGANVRTVSAPTLQMEGTAVRT